MAQEKAPFKVGDRISHMPTGYTLVPAIVVSVQRNESGSWRMDVRTQDGILKDRPTHRDWSAPASQMSAETRAAWESYWEDLEKQEASA